VKSSNKGMQAGWTINLLRKITTEIKFCSIN